MAKHWRICAKKQNGKTLQEGKNRRGTFPARARMTGHAAAHERDHFFVTVLVHEHTTEEDDAYSRRPATLITNVDKLLSIPNVEFLKYSDSQRSNLIQQFSAIHYR